ncbi:unnamed protein product, partial [Dovyalis caffra]
LVKKWLKSSLVIVVGDEAKRIRMILLTFLDPNALEEVCREDGFRYTRSYYDILGRKKELFKWEDVRKMRHSWNVIFEVMRLLPPIYDAFREVIVYFTYVGYTIPKGSK